MLNWPAHAQFVYSARTTELERGISERNYNFDKQCFEMLAKYYTNVFHVWLADNIAWLLNLKRDKRPF